MRKAKYKPWQVSLNQKWILINTVTKWDTSVGLLSYDKRSRTLFMFILSITKSKFFRSGSLKSARAMAVVKLLLCDHYDSLKYVGTLVA